MDLHMVHEDSHSNTRAAVTVAKRMITHDGDFSPTKSRAGDNFRFVTAAAHSMLFYAFLSVFRQNKMD